MRACHLQVGHWTAEAGMGCAVIFYASSLALFSGYSALVLLPLLCTFPAQKGAYAIFVV